MATVFVETTVAGHLAGRLHADPIIAARQVVTRRWWPIASARHRLLISQLVLDECAGGDPTAARERLEVVALLALLDVTDAVDDLADALTANGAIPPSEPRDAFHIAIAAVNGAQYLVTWNFKHIANAAMRGSIESVCRNSGFEHPLSVRPKNWPENTMPDSPTDEIRAIRHELAAKFDNDIKRIGEDLRLRQQASGCEYIRLPKRIPHSQHTANQTSHAPTSRE